MMEIMVLMSCKAGVVLVACGCRNLWGAHHFKANHAKAAREIRIHESNLSALTRKATQQEHTAG